MIPVHHPPFKPRIYQQTLPQILFSYSTTIPQHSSKNSAKISSCCLHTLPNLAQPHPFRTTISPPLGSNKCRTRAKNLAHCNRYPTPTYTCKPLTVTSWYQSCSESQNINLQETSSKKVLQIISQLSSRKVRIPLKCSISTELQSTCLLQLRHPGRIDILEC